MFFKNIRSVVMPVLAAMVLALLPAMLHAQNNAVISIAPAPTPDLESLTSPEVVRMMGLGWNLGNTMEAWSKSIPGGTVRDFETAWGNPETTKAMIDAIRDAGFKSVRIPVAWSNMMGDNYQLNPQLMDRVQQIADWVQKDGMIAVVNIHWDGGWWSKFPTDYDNCMKHYTRVWTQISDHFKNQPGTLIFESLNEEGCFNDVWNRYGGPDPDKKKKAYDILNAINQTFVDIVRKSGGLNAKRHLLIAGYATDIDLVLDPDFQMPKDPAGHCILSVHYYTPFTFAGLEQDATWGKARFTWGTADDLQELNTNMEKLRKPFLDQGIPVIIGEYGATTKNKDPNSVRLYMLSVAQKVYSMGMCPMLWDPGEHFNRRTLAFNDPELLAGFQKIMGMKREDSAAAPTPAGK